MLLEHVPADGSSIGNLKLRDQLRWDEERYAAARDDLDLDALLGTGVTIEVDMSGEKNRATTTNARYLNGFFSRITYGGFQTEGRPVFRTTIVPWLWFLTRRSDCRIFHKKSVREIIKQVFSDAGFSECRFDLKGSYPAIKYCVQYRVTDFNIQGVCAGRKIKLAKHSTKNQNRVRKFISRVLQTLDERRERMRYNSFLAKIGKKRRHAYKKSEPPEEFLKKGSRLYKKAKLKTLWVLADCFQPGIVFSEREVDSLIRFESQFQPHFHGDATHLRRALIELGILERTRNGSRYWRIPDLEMTGGLIFPNRIGDFEKAGYVFFGEPELGFSIAYHQDARQIIATVYLYGDAVCGSTMLQVEYRDSLRDLIDYRLEQGIPCEVLSEQSCFIAIEDQNGTSQLNCCTAELRLATADDRLPSRLLLTTIRGRFIKVRMTFGEETPDSLGLIQTFTEELLRAWLIQGPE